MDQDLIHIAKSDIRSAMRKEIELNQVSINDTGPWISRSSPRPTKEYVFALMARNDALRHFLSLEPHEQLPEKLRARVPISQEYQELMNRIRATKYPLQIKEDAQQRLYYDYTYPDHRRKRHFLDQPLPHKSGLEKLIERLNTAANWFGILIVWGVVGMVVWSVVMAIINPSNNYSQNYSSNGNNTFSEGGTSGGNAGNKPVDDSPQVRDSHVPGGFGNDGVSGYDAPALSNSFGSVEAGQSVLQSADEKSGFNVPIDRFTLGSTKYAVDTIMGKPSSFLSDMWSYEYSTVYFGDDETVVGWSNIGGNLKVSIGDKIEDAPPFSLASTQKDVIDAMGTPSTLIGDMWSYEYSSVYFGSEGKVVGWSNIGMNLKVSIGPRKKDAPPFTVGSTKQSVVDAMGTPTSIIGEAWGFEYSSVYFDTKGNVSRWADISGNLRVE